MPFWFLCFSTTRTAFLQGVMDNEEDHVGSTRPASSSKPVQLTPENFDKVLATDLRHALFDLDPCTPSFGALSYIQADTSMSNRWCTRGIWRRSALVHGQWKQLRLWPQKNGPCPTCLDPQSICRCPSNPQQHIILLALLREYGVCISNVISYCVLSAFPVPGELALRQIMAFPEKGGMQ